MMLTYIIFPTTKCVKKSMFLIFLMHTFLYVDEYDDKSAEILVLVHFAIFFFFFSTFSSKIQSIQASFL